VFSQKRNDALVTIESCCNNVVTQKGRAPAAAALDAAAASALSAAPPAAALAAAASASGSDPASAEEKEKKEVGTEGGGGGCAGDEFPFQAKVDLVLASVTCKYTQSNSVCFAKDGQVCCMCPSQKNIYLHFYFIR
jgi:hypothetical protein